MESRTTPIAFEKVTAALLDNNQPFPPSYLHRFSDLSREDLRKLQAVWNQVLPDRRASLLEDLESLTDADTLVDFDDLCIFALDDSDARVRATALSMLWESENPSLASKFIQIMETDEEMVVRAHAATALGQYVYLGELEEISPEIHKNVEEHLLALLNKNENPLVQRRALESLGFSSRDEVSKLIQKAYNSNDKEWQASALYAMGRSADQNWSNAILEAVDDPEDDIKLEAIRAAGELELASARGQLLELLDEGIDDDEIRMAVVWSLSKIGGEDVRETLEEMLENIEDDDEAGFIEEALDNLYFTEGFDQMGMFDFEGKDEQELDSLMDLNNKDDDDLPSDDDIKYMK